MFLMLAGSVLHRKHVNLEEKLEGGKKKMLNPE